MFAPPRGVANFEHYLAGQDYSVPFEAITKLYKDPTNLLAIEDERLRHMAHAMIEQVDGLRERGEGGGKGSACVRACVYTCVSVSVCVCVRV